ncbi:hypothetical protein TTHERM_01027460 (macronuclear) [Tetrahymena thermophila SB210]|uniref:Uncharacterized protein n=1 Tax=Tetrahymena thermophila (strain SB210) TaxID=312017 RepID=Q22CN2_TETTS|nr:hypothetical protein TTHERM_01027460 [Tetrahymena thermophila SB210]EAR83020.2 hypothetical protein TTHERM_01027460 [Tetrahymena thermophila SB210]|eukprot:XP_001030683.2 hypothetical protein TTHERM_01027460 [Tetrahymena thermophila SB210]
MTSYSSTPKTTVSNHFQKQMSQLLSSNITIDVKEFQKMYNNLYGITRPVNLTSSETTEKILANSSIPYDPPQNIHKAQFYRQLALDKIDNKKIVEKADKESKKEVENAIKRLQNKKLKKQIQEGQKKNLEKKIKMLDDNVQYIVDLYKTINDAREKLDEEARKNQQRLKNLRKESQENIKKIREDIILQKIQEKRKLQSISQVNIMEIRRRNEQEQEQNMKRRLEMLNRKKQSQNKLVQYHKSKIQNIKDQSVVDIKQQEETEEKLLEAQKILRKIVEEEEKLTNDMRFNEEEKYRMKSELGLVLPNQKHHASHYDSQGFQTPNNLSIANQNQHAQSNREKVSNNTFLTSL